MRGTAALGASTLLRVLRKAAQGAGIAVGLVGAVLPAWSHHLLTGLPGIGKGTLGTKHQSIQHAASNTLWRISTLRRRMAA